MEKVEGIPEVLPFDRSVPDSPAHRLKWILAGSMGAADAFENRRTRLEKRRSRSVGDHEVVESFLSDLRPGGGTFEYLKLAQLAAVIDNTLFTHGVSNDDTLGLVPGKGYVDDPIRAIEGMNQWYRDQFVEFEKSGGTSGAAELIAYQERHPGTPFKNHASMIYGRLSDDSGNTQLPSRRVRNYYRKAKVNRESLGHTPQGETGSLVVGADFQAAVIDVSYAPGDKSSFAIYEGNRAEIYSYLPDDRLVKAVSVIGVDSPIGKSTPDGFLISGQLDDGSYYAKRVGEKYRVEAKIFTAKEISDLKLVVRDTWADARSSQFRGKDFGFTRDQAQRIRSIEFESGWELTEAKDASHGREFVFVNNKTRQIYVTENPFSGNAKSWQSFDCTKFGQK